MSCLTSIFLVAATELAMWTVPSRPQLQPLRQVTFFRSGSRHGFRPVSAEIPGEFGYRTAA